MGYDDIVVTGAVSEGKFSAYYTCGNDVIAVATMNADPVAAEVAQCLLAGQRLKKSELLKRKPGTGNNNRY